MTWNLPVHYRPNLVGVYVGVCTCNLNTQMHGLSHRILDVSVQRHINVNKVLCCTEVIYCAHLTSLPRPQPANHQHHDSGSRASKSVPTYLPCAYAHTRARPIWYHQPRRCREEEKDMTKTKKEKKKKLPRLASCHMDMDTQASPMSELRSHHHHTGRPRLTQRQAATSQGETRDDVGWSRTGHASVCCAGAGAMLVHVM
ncbi:hypothetical protein B0T22DRAFT_89658 [Podospora appendiculata]|uniref:Uncharacterized protein n=1 Tax=Podospora appendiculata TaxID=314037 RepID=A0AAE1CHY0_9PEZI|nr:hypothetical protein B0T22DRAFT_89658 [Podospora appendiculata]